MEFGEKLQQLRAQKNMTQEQLSEHLYVSRTAVSKWESGKGYPNIESLKCISKFFSISIDELLSGEELITLAQTENKTNLSKVYHILWGILDVLVLLFIVLPLYGNLVNGHVYAVNLLSFTAKTSLNIVIYWCVLFTLAGCGIAKLLFIRFKKDSWYSITVKVSLLISVLAILFFVATREPYVTALLFMLFLVKIVLLMKQIELK
jgi:transcriptional regulator with XRE-family HTH domain